MKYLFIPCCVLFACPHKASPQLMGRKEVLPHGFGAKASQIGMDCWDKRKKMGVGLSLPSPLPMFYCLVKCAPGSAAERCTLFSPNPHCSCTSSARNVGSGTGLGKHTSVYWEWLFSVCLLTCSYFKFSYFKFWYTVVNYPQLFVKVLAEEEEHNTMHMNKNRISSLNQWNSWCTTPPGLPKMPKCFAWKTLS